jgi:hypothetical protein
MLKIIAIVGAVLLAAIAVILAVAARKPDDFRVTRTVLVQAPPEKIYPLIADFHRWAEWSPYEKKDPAMKRTFSGAGNGVGAVYAWDGDKNVGSGRMEIANVTEPSEGGPAKIALKLDFLKPFEGHNMAEFTMVPLANGTTVSWVMYGPSPLIAKVMGLFFDMDKMIGDDFALGLANLKSAAEK